MIAQELEVSLHMAFVEARQQRHEFITVEHLLLALLDNPSAAEVLRACSAQVDDLRQSLSTFIKDNTPQVAGTEEVDTQPTLGFQRVIQRAIMHVQSTGSGKKEVTGANVLVAILVKKIRTLCTTCTSKALLVWTSSTSSPTVFVKAIHQKPPRAATQRLHLKVKRAAAVLKEMRRHRLWSSSLRT